MFARASLGGVMTTGSKISAILIALFWAIFGPLSFATLYAVIEVQAAARASLVGEGPNATPKGDPRLATLNVIALGHRLDVADAASAKVAAQQAGNRTTLVDVFLARGALRAAAISILNQNGVPNASTLCTASPDDLNQCQLNRNMKSCTADLVQINLCHDRALQLVQQGKVSADDARALKDTKAKANDVAAVYTRNTQDLNELKQTHDALAANPVYPVAETYRTIQLPLFQQLFVLPQGVIVAFFTALMAALGAGVSSLVKIVANVKTEEETPRYLFRLFAFAPLLGGLAGFMVYFVVSAGAAFLIQGDLGAASQAVNNLSVPALASLGVFAGLAASDAIAWLQAKAATFFKL
jgi:hypothetical protein